jgi:Glycine-zipper domain
MRRVGLPLVVTGTVLLGGCVAPPTGPTVLALPGQNKPFDRFQQEDGYCRQTAAGTAAPATANAQNNAVGSAVVGTAVGAGAGALIGAAAGNAGAGAAIGAGSGLLLGSAAGANNAAGGGYYAQQQYDATYAACMTAYGNQIQSQPAGYAGAYPYPAPYPYAAPYAYPYPYAYTPGVVVGGYWGPRYWGPRWHRW